MTICTIFNGGLGYNQFPISPTGDNKFTFTNIKVENNLHFLRTMISNFILNIPLLRLSEPLESYRRKDNLEKYYDKNVDYFIMDVDNIKSKSSLNKVIEFFKDYKVILGESESYNGIDNFSMKGVLFCNPVLIRECKYAILALNDSLKEYCIIHPSSSRMATYNPPLNKERIIINNDNGILYTFDRNAVNTQVNIIKESYEYSKHFSADNVDSSKLKSTLNREFIESITDEAKFYESIEELALYVFGGMGFEYIDENEQGALTFKHHSEINSSGGYFWFKTAPYTMNHLNILKTVNIFDAIKKLPQAKALMTVELNYDELLSSPYDECKDVVIKNDKYLDVDSKVKRAVQHFLYHKETKLLKIKSGMGTGKSTVIDHLIKEAHHDDLSILIITNRISVAHDFNKKYNIKIYNTDAYHIGDSLICQYDSLWRYDIQYFDIVIMDEFVSVLLHSRSAMNKSPMNTNKFFKSFNKKVVIADAFLTGYEDHFFDSVDTAITIENTYRDPTQLYSYKHASYFNQIIMNTAKKEKITVSSTSTTFIKALESMLYKHGIRVTTLTSDTSDLSKQIIYNSFQNDDNDLFDVLIYSPTLTVGISNLNIIGKHFHYDSSKSTDVISSLQMIKRTRKTSEIHYHVKDTKKYSPLSYSVLRDDYINKIGKQVDQNDLFEYDDYGNPNISKLGKMCIMIDVYKNILGYSHISAFEKLLTYHFEKVPIVINTQSQTNILSRYQKMLKIDKLENNKMALDQYVKLTNIDQLSLDVNIVDDALKNIIQIRENLNTDDKDILQEMINIQLKDALFISKCFYWKLTKLSQSPNNMNYLQRLTSNAISDNDIVKYNNINLVIDFGINIEERYSTKKLNKQPKLKSFVKLLGFKEMRGGDTHAIGVRAFSIDPNVEKYHNYVKI